MIRYRRMACSTNQAIKAFSHLPRLGKLSKIVAKRFRVTRSAGGHTFTATHEAIMVYGEHGTARFEGLCWGYGGEGPRGTHQLLLACGVADPLAKDAAFKTPRKDQPGTDWTITFDGETAKLAA
jgi:hypothetical protein